MTDDDFLKAMIAVRKLAASARPIGKPIVVVAVEKDIADALIASQQEASSSTVECLTPNQATCVQLTPGLPL